MTRVIIALDSFKGSISAVAASAAVEAGWRSIEHAPTVTLYPMADGGEGTLDAFAAAVKGARRIPVTVSGPRGTPVQSSWLLLPDGTGVIELATTSGIELLGDELLPWDADTRGFGQAIAAALDHGVRRVALAIGSSSSTDGGVGVLTALGARVMNVRGHAIGRGARGLSELAVVDLRSMRPMPSGGAIVITDVTNPLLGPTGAAAVFGPQKGLDADGAAEAEAGLAHLAELIGGDVAMPGAGAAGGAGFGLAAWGASVVPGAAEVDELIGLSAAIHQADLVITGEGSFDGQSGSGKVPGYVAEAASKANVPVALIAGRISSDADTSAFAETISLTALAGGSSASFAQPARWLRAAGSLLAQRA